MKRLGRAWEQIISVENLRVALYKAAKGRKRLWQVKRILRHEDYFLEKLHNLLESGNYRTGSYKSKVIYEPKERIIHSLPFYPDRVVHHAIINILGPYWETLFINESYACRKGKGQHSGSLKCSEFVRRNSYVLKCDISKFYHNIDHEIIKRILKRKIKDKKVLSLLYEIIDSSNTCKALKSGVGMPIGNLISQWLGNIYLNELDMYIKHELHIHDYVRYCDDFVLFSNDKNVLNVAAIKIRNFLQGKLHLRMSKCNLFPATHGVDYLGYRHFAKYVLLRKSTAKRIKRRLFGIAHGIKIGHLRLQRALGQLASAMGWLRWANTGNFKLALHIESLWVSVRERWDAWRGKTVLGFC